MSHHDPLNPYAPPSVESTTAAQSETASPFPACPNCRMLGAKKVSWTVWGGALGPRILNLVRCQNCRTSFNGKTGKSCKRAILIYNAVAIGVAIAIGLAMATM